MATWAEMPRSPGHAFYDRLQELLRESEFDAFVEEVCKPYYAPRMGAPSLPPGRYFRMHMIGYFEGIDSERGLAWRCADSYSLRDFLRLSYRDKVPDHSWLSRTRSRCRTRRTRRCSALSDQFFGLSLAVVASVDGQPVSIFQQLARSDPSGRDDVREIPLSLRNVEDLLAERGIDISHETVRFWWSRFGPMFAAEIRKKRVAHMRGYPQWRWHLDEAFVKINGKLCYLWRAVDHEGEVLEGVVTAKRDKAAALKFLKRVMRSYGRPRNIVTDGLRAYSAAMKEIGNVDRQEVGRWLNNRAENSHQPFRRRERAMQRFRSPKTLQKLTSVHAQVHNHFHQERHLVTRQVYKQRRAGALAEWRALAA